MAGLESWTCISYINEAQLLERYRFSFAMAVREIDSWCNALGSELFIDILGRARIFHRSRKASASA